MKTITDIEGVYASGVHCGIKPEKKDLAFVYVPNAFGSAGVFTQNKFRAPCLDYSAHCLSQGTVKAVIVNAGNANAATGEQGYTNAARTAELAAPLLGLRPEEVVVGSTGIIGVQLPMEKIERGLAQLLADPHARQGKLAAEAILTLDTHIKQVYTSGSVGGREVAVAGFAKGAGMIAPNMGTMLAYLAVTAAVQSNELLALLRQAVDESFNMVSVDTDTSTNDMVLIFSTGAVEVNLGDESVTGELRSLISSACRELAKMIAGDGEGAEKRIEVLVRNAASREDARKIAKNIVGSPLVKAAVHGADPNWGRVLMATGKDPSVNVDPGKIDLFFGTEQILSASKVLPFSRDAVAALLRRREVQIVIDLHQGTASATAWGCDLTKKYVEINADYN